MDKKINGKKILFFIIIIAVCIIMQRFVLGIIIILSFFINSLKSKGRNINNTGKTGRKNYGSQPSALSKQGSKRNYPVNFAKTEEQKQREKWAKRRDKDPWEWDE